MFHSLRQILLPAKDELVRTFKEPFDAGMYVRYYRRQLLKVLTLARHEPPRRASAAATLQGGTYQRTVAGLDPRGRPKRAGANGHVVTAQHETGERR